tara:strand:- start:1027 stop:1239 length:213 start_codon:yes stop_codon:yes gene_type:complete
VTKEWSVVYISTQMEISREQLQELTEVITDTIQYSCDQWQISGEKAWTIVHCLSIAKLAELEGLVTSDVA